MDHPQTHGIEFFHSGELLLAIVVRAGASSDAKYNFLTSGDQPLQLGMNFYSAGEVIKNHSHLPREIRVTRVNEAIIMSAGRARLRLFDDSRREVTDTVLERGDVVLLVGGGHGFEILEDAKIVEVKQGPYDGKSQDKVVF